MDDVENDDALASGSRLDRVSNDVGQTGNGFLECAVHSAFAASATSAKLFAGLPDRRRNFSRRFRIFPRNVKMPRPSNRPAQRVTRGPAASLAFRRQCNRGVEFIHGLIVRHKRPAFISANPRAIPSKM